MEKLSHFKVHLVWNDDEKNGRNEEGANEPECVI